MKRVYVFIMLIVGMTNYAQSSLKIGGNPYYLTKSAILEVESTTKGILPPRLTTSQRDLISLPANGLFIFNTTTNKLEFNSGTTGAPSWSAPEIVSNKSTVTTLGTSDVLFPTQNAVKTYVDANAAPSATSILQGKLKLTNELSGTADLPTITNAAVIGKVLTGFTSGSGTVSAADNILQAFQKIDGNVALKAPLASPTFTGTVTAPTPSTSSNGTVVATTAFVNNLINSTAIAIKTANYTAVAADQTLLFDCTSAALTLTLPAAASNVGKIYTIRKVDDSNDLNFSPAIKFSTTITSAAMNIVGTVRIQSDGTDWWVIN